MKNIMKTGFMLIAAAVIISSFSVASFADTTVITTSRQPYFHSGAGPVSSIFYFIGDVVVLPFRLVGNLLS